MHGGVVQTFYNYVEKLMQLSYSRCHIHLVFHGLYTEPHKGVEPRYEFLLYRNIQSDVTRPLRPTKGKFQMNPVWLQKI